MLWVAAVTLVIHQWYCSPCAVAYRAVFVTNCPEQQETPQSQQVTNSTTVLDFADSAKNLLEHNKIYAASYESYSLALYFQRNVLISGGR